MPDCEHCVYGHDVSWPELPPYYECLNDVFEEEWLEQKYCPGYEEKLTRYDIKLSEV